MIVRIFLRDLLHRLRIGRRALLVIHFAVLAIKSAESFDVIAFARSVRANCVSFLQQVPAALQIDSIRPAPKLVIQAHGLSPVGHRALWIAFLHLLELFVSSVVPERMQQCNAALEWLLHARCTGGRKRNSSQLFSGSEMLVLFVGP